MNIKQDFRVYCSTNFKELNKSLIESSFREDGALYIEGVASTTSTDEEGDYMTESCLDDMKRQVLGLNVLKEHGQTLDDIVGNVTQVLESNKDNFKIKFKVLPRFEHYLLELLENDINLGFSIGAKALDYEPKDDSEFGWKINKVKLYEISLVPLPANWDSFGSVKISKVLDNDDSIVAKCFNGACKQILKEYNGVVKEVEDAHIKDEDKFVSKKDCLNMMNELAIQLYERLLSELIDENKRMYEKTHLNCSQKEETNNESENEDKSSNGKEDKEKNKEMTIKENEKIETEEKTPDVEKELEDEKRTSEEVKQDIEKEITVNVKADEVSNADVLKSIGEMKSFFTEKFDKELDEKLDAKLEKMKNDIRNDIEEDLFKELTTERQPVETKQPEIVEKEVEVKEEEKEVNKAMNAHEIAKMLCS